MNLIQLRMFFNILAVIFIFFIVGGRAQCSEGFYNNSGYCVKCTKHCSFCNSTKLCFLCDNGYFGDNCTKLCAKCKPNTKCTQDKGICEAACNDGLSGQYCDKPCDSTCMSCARSETTKCLTYKNNKSEENVCPEDCPSQVCNGQKCSNGCFPGYWGQACNLTCPEHCKAGFNHMPGTDVNTVADENVAVPVLSVLLVMLLGVVFSMLFWIRRLSRHRDSPVVLYRPEDITMRPIGTQRDHVEILSNSDRNSADNYDHVVLQVYATSEAEVLEEQLTYTYEKPIDAENLSGISEESTATSGTTKFQNNAGKCLRNKKHSYFSTLLKDDNLPDLYKPLACTATDTYGRQNKPTTEIPNKVNETGADHQEEFQSSEYHSSDIVSAYITPTK